MQTDSRALPVIVGYGGFNAAGRVSGDQAYRRMILESLDSEQKQRTITGLACLMNLVKWADGCYKDDDGNELTLAQVTERYTEAVCEGTLIRRIEKEHFDCDNVPWNQKMELAASSDGPVTFKTRKKSLPAHFPEGWNVTELEDGLVEVTIDGNLSSLVKGSYDFPVKAAAQIPSGFKPGEIYNSRFQPRGLQFVVVGASDALHSMGIDWQVVSDAVEPDEIGVYACSGLGQMGDEGFGGVLNARANGGRPTAKQVPLGLNSMPADFVNAYILGSVGHTEAITGACASYLYNLRAAVRDITSGIRRVALVGGSEAPVLTSVMEGFSNMGALATEEAMKKIDGTDTADARRYSRPFGENSGFVMAESVQYTLLMDDALAMELGADIYGAVPGVFIDADGVKKSISSPGPGNYITMAKAVGLATAVVGEESVQKRSMVQAHGSSTPANRVTESLIFERVAEAFGISDWPITAIKAYVGHSLGSASGDQLHNTLGIFKHGIIPGIKTIDKVADDVYADRLTIPLQDLNVGVGNLDVAFINAKGFGGNNATAVAVAPEVTEKMLAKRYGEDAFSQYVSKREKVREKAAAYFEEADRGELNPIYRFGEGMIDESELSISNEQMTVPGFAKPVKLSFTNPYEDMSA